VSAPSASVSLVSQCQPRQPVPALSAKRVFCQSFPVLQMQKRVFETMFYVLNKNEMSNMILELSELKQIETKLNYQMFI
jgi:hypothetical protein